jgi:hypothetical protein
VSTTLAVAAPAYSPPAVAFHGETARREEAVWWVVVVGFAYAVALGWTGFKVVCRK